MLESEIAAEATSVCITLELLVLQFLEPEETLKRSNMQPELLLL